MLFNRRTIVGILVFLGLFLLFLGAAFIDLSRSSPRPGEPPSAALDRADREAVWGPLAAHAGMFLLIMGLLGAAVFFQDLDVFARLFLLILAFISILLILAGSATVFGVP